MYQPKVFNTQQYSDGQGEHVVCKGKILFFGQHELNIQGVALVKGNMVADFKPIIISETEELKEGDHFLVINEHNNQYHQILECFNSNDEYVNEESFDELGWHKSNVAKVLSLPKHFSDKHLQAIVDGKMKDGDEVLIKCHKRRKSSSIPLTGQGIPEYVYRIDLNNRQKHITLFPAKQSLEEAAFNYADSDKQIDETSHLDYHGILQEAFKAGAEWAKENNF